MNFKSATPSHMSFLDKFFSNRNRSNNYENALKPEIEGLSFRSSQLKISKDQIRFVLFRECDKRGRKLLFDSSSVEKVLLSSRESMCHSKQSEKSDFIETNNTHGYKYKKPPSDVSSLGEMVFGSVAVVYKTRNSCKIHCIPSPKRLMFTTIVHAPFRRSPGSTVSELNLVHSSESSLASFSNIASQQLTSSSDSKLYKHEGVAQKYSSTYPWIKHNFPTKKEKQCCERSEVNLNFASKSFFENSSEIKCSESLLTNNGSENFYSEESFSLSNGTNLCLCLKNLECEGNSLSNYGSSGITSNESGKISSVSGSSSSIRRRWTHSYSTSLDSTAFEDISSSPSKKRTKLGLALVLDLRNTLENEIEKLLFNHTVLIDSIMCRLQDSVELAYIRNDSFVNLIYTAFLESQESIYELITGGKYKTPLWCTILGDSENFLEAQLNRTNFCKKNTGACNKWDLVNNIQLKFLNDFCNVLVRFDTKDTNFFISTLLTAVLTHHLSWVTLFAETDLKSSSEKLSVINSIRPYNPIWAQMNDLCGLLGSPLKSAKTVIIGPESKKNQLASIIEFLSYFIRCNNVVENVYEVDVENIICEADLESSKTDLNSFSESDGCRTSEMINFERQIDNSKELTTSQNGSEKPSNGEQGCREKLKPELLLLQPNDYQKSGLETALKRSKSYSSNMKMEGSVNTNELYPDITDLARSENIFIPDLNYEETERTIFVENFLTANVKLKEKIQTVIRVPNVSVKPPVEKYISADDGYDTIDSKKTDNFKDNIVQMERQRSAPETKREDIVFLLGENEELVNLQKKIVMNKSSFVDIEKEEATESLSVKCKGHSVGDCNESKSKGNCRTSQSSWDTVDKTIWVDRGNENCIEHSSKSCSRQNVSVKTPWIVREIKMPKVFKPCRTRRLEVCSVLGGVNQNFNSEQIIQAVLEPKKLLEQSLQKDLFLCSHNPILEKNVTEALCIVGDMESWEVTVFSSNKSVLDYNKRSEIRVGMSQLVADMLESLLYLHTGSLSPGFCLLHIEKKLHEIYLKSKTVAELLDSTELCSIDYLTTNLDISTNDVPLLLSVATTHSPHVAEKYVLSYS